MCYRPLVRALPVAVLFFTLASLLVAGCGELPDDSVVPLATFTGSTETAQGDSECASSQDEDCCEACALVHECRPAVSVDECEERCLRSSWVPTHQIRCLALRVFWIDEELCPRVGPTWDNFDDDDSCSGPGPDEEGYGPF